MISKKILNMNVPEEKLYIVILGIASIFLLYFKFYVGAVFFIVFLCSAFYNWRTSNIKRKEWNNYIKNLSLDIDEEYKKYIIVLVLPTGIFLKLIGVVVPTLAIL